MHIVFPASNTTFISTCPSVFVHSFILCILSSRPDKHPGTGMRWLWNKVPGSISSTSPSSCYASPSTLVPYIPLQASNYYTDTNISSDNTHLEQCLGMVDIGQKGRERETAVGKEGDVLSAPSSPPGPIIIRNSRNSTLCLLYVPPALTFMGVSYNKQY